MRLCKRCGHCKPEQAFGKSIHGPDGLNYYCKRCTRQLSKAAYADPAQRAHKLEMQREIYAKARTKAIATLGSVCVACGNTDIRVLQIDHINGGGVAENRSIKPRGIIHKVNTGAAGYQLLCANCNWIKRHENNELPYATLELELNGQEP